MAAASDKKPMFPNSQKPVTDVKCNMLAWNILEQITDKNNGVRSSQIVRELAHTSRCDDHLRGLKVTLLLFVVASFLTKKRIYPL